MRTILATLAVATLIVTVGTSPAAAAPTEVNVRIEGKAETLFEGPILTDGRDVRASSDAKAPKAGRRCNGLNNGQNPAPGPTPTAAAVDAMAILGEDFDGQWYDAPFEDYFIKRWGPDRQDELSAEFWGLVVNNVYTDVGGCQYGLDAGDEVLWTYDAFRDKPLLALFPAGYAGGSRPLTTSVELGEPFAVEVDSYENDGEAEPPASPQRAGAVPFEGAEVAPVVTGAGGFEAVDVEGPATVLTDESGLAEIAFGEPGWHRIKATVAGPGGTEGAIRSNRLDVCVFEASAAECATPPADDQARIPPPLEPAGEDPEDDGPEGQVQAGVSGQLGAGGAHAGVATRGPVRLELPRLDRRRLAHGRLGVSWRVLDAGIGIRGWTISAKALGRKGARFAPKARGTSATSAWLRLSLGATYLLRISVVDDLGRSSTAPIGKVRVPDRGD